MKRILVPVDGSPTAVKALDTAIQAAKLIDGNITVLTVIAEHFGGFAESGGSETTPAIAMTHRRSTELAKTAGEAGLATFMAGYKDCGVTLDHKIAVGVIDDQITKLAREGNYDLIVIGRRGLNPLERMFVGSVTQRVIASAPCTVVVVRED